MTTEGIVAAFLSISYSARKKKESPIEPFKRTLELANTEYDKATEKLLSATNELANLTVVKEQEEKDAKS